MSTIEKIFLVVFPIIVIISGFLSGNSFIINMTLILTITTTLIIGITYLLVTNSRVVVMIMSVLFIILIFFLVSHNIIDINILK